MPLFHNYYHNFLKILKNINKEVRILVTTCVAEPKAAVKAAEINEKG
jgi:hypothetical protein